MINYDINNVKITMLSNNLPGGVLTFDALHSAGFSDLKTTAAIQSTTLTTGALINVIDPSNEYTFTLNLGYDTPEEKALTLFYETTHTLKRYYNLTIIVKDENNNSVVTYINSVITKPSVMSSNATAAKTWTFKAENRSVMYY